MQMRPAFEEVIEYEMTRLRTLVAERALFVEHNVASDLVVGFEDSWPYPLDGPFAETEINAPAF